MSGCTMIIIIVGVDGGVGGFDRISDDYKAYEIMMIMVVSFN